MDEEVDMDTFVSELRASLVEFERDDDGSTFSREEWLARLLATMVSADDEEE